MKFSWIIPPVIGAKSTMSQWAIQFFPSTESEVSKTNTTDDTVFIGTTMSQCIIALDVLRFLHRIDRLQSGPNKPVFSCTYADHLKRWKKAFSQVGLAHMHITPHLFTHGCASHDAIIGKSRAAIKTRGEATSEASVDRYMKPGRYLTMLYKMTEEQLISAWARINQLEHKLCHLVIEPANSDFVPRFLLLCMHNQFVSSESTNSNFLPLVFLLCICNHFLQPRERGMGNPPAHPLRGQVP